MAKNIFFLPILLSIIIFSSCSKRNLVYFSDLQDSTAYVSQILNEIEPRIQSDDILSITVSTLSPESNNLFNQGIVPTVISQSGTSNFAPNPRDGYVVDKEGFINYPVIGKVKLAGLTREQARDLMTRKITEFVKDPIVNIRFINFRITVIGEVNRPGSFIVPTDKVNVLEGLGMAGDMTPFGRRENVLIVREQDGKRTMTRLDLNEKSAFNSPYFYLQQNDIVYVEPHVIKRRGTSDFRGWVGITISSLTLLTLMAVRFRVI